MFKPKVKAPQSEVIENVHNILNTFNLKSVCESAACPNRAECYARGATTFMILGNVCTRACTFCHIQTGKGEGVDDSEPKRLAQAIQALKLRYVVITSVDRDDLKDYGASHFKECVDTIKIANPNTKIELLTPDFQADKNALETIIDTDVHKLAHNQETIERLCRSVRPQSSYKRSLDVLEQYAKYSQSIIKSSLMLGLGEREDELFKTMQDLLNVGVSEITLGQYLQPTQKHHKVAKYYPQDYFDFLKDEAYSMGFRAVASGILVRSSYFAETY